DAGSDAANISTVATRRDGKYILNGSKVFITNGDTADTLLVFATLDRAQRHKGVVVLIVEKGAPGLEQRKQHDKLGMRSSGTAEVVFRDTPVPAENVVTPAPDGFKTAMQILDGSRPIIGAQAVGIAQGALDLALRHVRQRKQFGQAIADFQGVQWMLADMATKIDASRLLVYRAASLRDQGLPFSKEASMAKLFASETAMYVATQALQLHGGSGYFKDSPIERYFRDAKVTEIYEGTSRDRAIASSGSSRPGARTNCRCSGNSMTTQRSTAWTRRTRPIRSSSSSARRRRPRSRRGTRGVSGRPSSRRRWRRSRKRRSRANSTYLP
ncbi:MAG: acyl-CoA dehydrogenase family protein, partial [Chloroflexi bacterium]|nr:acyl-CoA dehydrogenase family protein [Chloroflexota bacterium]